MIRSGHDESSAIALAIGAVKRWASGRGKVTPEVRAAASKALAEWEKLKAEHSKSKSFDDSLFTLVFPDIIKVGPEGYIHGFICVRPPCGGKPDKLKRDDVQVKRDGTIMHKKSGWAVGHVDKGDNGKYTATHSDGHTSKHQDKETAVRTLVGHYNNGKTKREFNADEKKPALAEKPTARSGKPAADELRGNTAGDLRPGDKVTAAFGGPPSTHTVVSADRDDDGNVKLALEDGNGNKHTDTISAGTEIDRVKPAGSQPAKAPAASKPSAAKPPKTTPTENSDTGKELRGDEALESVKRPRNLTGDEEDALGRYGTTSGYATVNPYLHHNGQVFDTGIMGYRKAKPNEQARAKSMISGMDSAFDKAPPLQKPIVVHRGTGNVEDMFGKPGSLVGKTFNAKSYTSTTTVPDAKVGNGFDYESKSGKLEIHVPAGSKVMPGNDFEHEVILPRDANFHVMSDDVDSKGQRHIKMAYEPSSSGDSVKDADVPDKVPGSDVPRPAAGEDKEVSADEADEAEEQANDMQMLSGLGGKSTQIAVAKKKSTSELQAADYGFQQRMAAKTNPKVTAAHQIVRDELANRGATLADLNVPVRKQSAAEVVQREKKALVAAWSSSYRYKGTSEVANNKRIDDFATEMHRLLSTNKPPTKCGSGCQDAHKFLDMVNKDSDVQPKELQRGLTLSPAAAERMFKPGKDLDMPVSSWTNDPSVGALYAKGEGESGKVKVLIHAAPGAKGLDISASSKWHASEGGAGGEAEVVTGGRFSVDNVETDGGIMNVYLTQKDFSAH